MAAVQAIAEHALVSGMETVSMCALFLSKGTCTDREASREFRARYTLTGECSSLFVPFKVTNQDHHF